MSSAEMKKASPLHLCRRRCAEQFAIAPTVLLKRLAEGSQIFSAKVEFPRHRGPPDFLFQYFQQELAVSFCEQFGRREVGHGFFKRVHVNAERDTKKERRMWRTRRAVSVAPTIGQRA